MASVYVECLLSSKWKAKGWKGEARPVSPVSVRRDINAIQPMWKVARKKWGFKGLENPFKDTDIVGSDVVSTRRLKPGELEAIINEVRNAGTWEQRVKKDGVWGTEVRTRFNWHRYYAPLALVIALLTGMRREERFDLTWLDVDISNRRIRIRETKTNIPRLIVLPMPTAIELSKLQPWLMWGDYVKEKYEYKETDYILYPQHTGVDEEGTRLAIDTFEDAITKARAKASLHVSS